MLHRVLPVHEVGDTVKIVLVHPKDAFYVNKGIMYAEGVIVEPCRSCIPGFFTGKIKLAKEKWPLSFYAVILKTIKKKEVQGNECE